MILPEIDQLIWSWSDKCTQIVLDITYNKFGTDHSKLGVYAIENGYLNIVKWVKDNCELPNDACEIAAMNGHLGILKFLLENECGWNSFACSWAAFNGHLEIVKWVKENGYEHDKWICSSAAFNGHLEVIKWVKDNLKDNYLDNTSICLNAAINGHLEVIKWAKENG